MQISSHTGGMEMFQLLPHVTWNKW